MFVRSNGTIRQPISRTGVKLPKNKQRLLGKLLVATAPPKRPLCCSVHADLEQNADADVTLREPPASGDPSPAESPVGVAGLAEEAQEKDDTFSGGPSSQWPRRVPFQKGDCVTIQVVAQPVFGATVQILQDSPIRA